MWVDPRLIALNWARQQRLRAELADLEAGKLMSVRRRSRRLEDATKERIAQVKEELVALNIQMNLSFAGWKKSA